MTRMLVLAAALAIPASGALACPFQKSVSVDTQTVASIEQPAVPMSTATQLMPVDDTTTAPAPVSTTE